MNFNTAHSQDKQQINMKCRIKPYNSHNGGIGLALVVLLIARCIIVCGHAQPIPTPRDYSPYYHHTNAIFASASVITSPEVLLESKNPQISQPEYRDFISKTLAAHPTNTLVVVCCRLNLPPSSGFVPGAHTLFLFCRSLNKPGDLDADIVKTNTNESGMFTVKDMYGIEDGVRVNPERPPHDDAHLAIYDSFQADGNGGLRFIMVFVADKQPQNLNIGVKGVIFLKFSFK
jgi:hypothetical protein